MNDILEFEVDFSTCNYFIDMCSIILYEIEETLTKIFLTDEEIKELVREDSQNKIFNEFSKEIINEESPDESPRELNKEIPEDNFDDFDFIEN